MFVWHFIGGRPSYGLVPRTKIFSIEIDVIFSVEGNWGDGAETKDGHGRSVRAKDPIYRHH